MSRTGWNDPARRVLAAVRYAGMRWATEAGELYLTANTGALTAAYCAAIDRHRAHLVRVLDALPARCVVPYYCCVVGPCHPHRCEQSRPQQEGRDAA